MIMRTMTGGKRFDVDVSDAAERLGVSEDTLRRWARQGKVAARQNLSRRWLFNADDLRLIGLRVGPVVVEQADG